MVFSPFANRHSITKEEKTKPKKVNFFADFQNCAKAGDQEHEMLCLYRGFSHVSLF